MQLYDIQNHFGLEAIQYQSNDKDIEKLENLFQDLIEFSNINFRKFPRPVDFFLNKETKRIIKAIDSVISERFNAKFKHINNSDTLYATHALTADTGSILSSVQGNLEYIFNNALRNQPDDIEVDDEIVDYEKDVFKVVNRYKTNLKNMKKQLDKENIIVDLKNAKLRNVPDDVIVLTHVNFKKCILELRLNARQMTGVLLHEIGHTFSLLENNFRQVYNSISMCEEIMNAKDGEKIDAINLSFKKYLNKDVKISKDNMLEGIVNTVKDLKDLSLGSKDKVDFQFEATADSFATRFGYGDDIITALNKIHDVFKGEIKPSDPGYELLMLICLPIIIAITLICLLPFIGLASVFQLTIGGFLLYLSKWTASYSLASSGPTTTFRYERFKKVKNDLIRLLRENEKTLTKDEISKIMGSFDNVKKIVEKYEPSNNNAVNNLALLFSSSARETESKRLLQRVLEDNTDNSLYALKFKLKNIKG